MFATKHKILLQGKKGKIIILPWTGLVWEPFIFIYLFFEPFIFNQTEGTQSLTYQQAPQARIEAIILAVKDSITKGNSI